MKAIIDRKTWLRGDKDSFLLRKRDGKMCCLGQLSLQCGLTQDDIIHKGFLSKLSEMDKILKHPILSQLVKEDRYCTKYLGSTIARELMNVNDNVGICDDQRETKLIELFKEIDVEIEFIN